MASVVQKLDVNSRRELVTKLNKYLGASDEKPVVSIQDVSSRLDWRDAGDVAFGLFVLSVAITQASLSLSQMKYFHSDFLRYASVYSSFVTAFLSVTYMGKPATKAINKKLNMKNNQSEIKSVFQVNSDNLKDDDSLLRSGLLDLHFGKKTVDPLGFYYNHIYIHTTQVFKAYSALDKSKRELERSEENLKLVQAQNYPAMIDKTRAQVKQAKKNVQEMKQELLSAETDDIHDVLKSDGTLRILPAFYKATGLLVSTPYFGDTTYRYLQNDWDIESLLALVPYDDQLRPKQVALNKMITDLLHRAATLEHEDALYHTDSEEKIDALGDLAGNLRELSDNFFLAYQEHKSDKVKLAELYDGFRKAIDQEISKVDGILDQHRGYTRAITHLVLTFVMGLGLATAALDYGCKSLTGSPLFSGQTTSRVMVEGIKESLLPELDSVFAAPAA